MSARSGRAVVGLDVISNTQPRKLNSQLHTVFDEGASLRSSQLSYMSPNECTLCPLGSQYIPTYHSPPPSEMKHPPCEFCEELKEWTNHEQRAEHSHKVEWCSDCGKKDVGPPCKCNITGCSEDSHAPYLQWQQDDNQCFYDDHLEVHRPPPRLPNPALMRASSECTLAQLNCAEDRFRLSKSHCRDPQGSETAVQPINVLHQRPSSSLRTRESWSGFMSPRTRETWSRGFTSPRTRETWSRNSLSPRLSRSLEDLPRDIKEHIMKCQCSCDHLGYGNFSSTSLQRLTGLSNGLSTPSSKHSSQDDLTRESPSSHKQRELDIRSHLWGVVCLVLVLAGVAGVGVSVPLALRNDSSLHLAERIEAAKVLLRETPLVDGHNDLPWNIRKFMHNKLHSFNMTADLSSLRPWSRSSWSHTDLPRLKRGHVGAQFWVSYVPCESQYLNAVQLTIEQIDLIKRLIDQYPDDMQLALSAEDVESSFRNGRIASLIGVEGGHAIQNSLGVLRALYDLGVRYMTLTHTCSTPWAESARNKESDLEDPESPRGLTHFGKTVVREMNRIGLLVDLSHVSQATMRAALQVSKAPILFSHSSVYAICKNPRNVPDDILRKVAENGGLVMISFYNHFLTCNKEATIRDVVDHINHVRNIAGIDHVGIGADFDGVDRLPKGLEDVSKYPNLFAELMMDPSWSEEALRKLAGLNLLRVLRDVEKVRIDYKERQVRPLEMEVPPNQLKGMLNCSYNFVEDNPS